MIAAEDDPFFPPGYVDRPAVAANPHLELALSPRGGHVGFVGGTVWRPQFWAEDRAADRLARALSPASSAPVRLCPA